MARPSKHDGSVYRRNDGKILWITYRDRHGQRIRESAFTEDWQQAQRKLRERLQARDGKILEIVRKGEQLQFETWVDYFLENYSQPPIRAEQTHQANMRAGRHLKRAFGSRKVGDVSADDIEVYLRRRLQERVRTRTKQGIVYGEKLKPATVHQELRVLRRILNVAVRKKLLVSNPCAGVEFPVAVRSLFRPHYMSWSEQQKIESSAPGYLRNVIRIITETGLRIYKELIPMKKDQLDLDNRTVWIPDSKTANGIAEVPLTEIAVEAFRSQLAIAGPGPFLFPSIKKPDQHRRSIRKTWQTVLERAGVSYFRIYDLRSTYATRLSAGGVADEWVTQLLRQGDAQVFKKYSHMKLQMKREALRKMDRMANESRSDFDTVKPV